jgi:HlyD family secretion protein
MSRKTWLLILVICLVAAGAIWLRQRSAGVPDVPFAKVVRETLVSSLSTNGKVEPSTWVSVRAERAGAVEKVAVRRGQDVRKGELLVQLTSDDARAEVASAEAALAQAQAQLQTVLQGGTAQAKVDIGNEIERNRAEIGIAQRDYATLKRLAAKQAATEQDVTDASERVKRLDAAIEGLEKKRAALVEPADRASADARVEQARARLQAARVALDRCSIRSLMDGTVYALPVRPGAFLNAGDLVASVGRLQTLEVRISVDEPELGRVALGMPVVVTWDALPGRRWDGTVEKMPTEVVPLGTRQVGEVLSTIPNPDLKLVPGTNVNVEITSQVVAGGLTIPKEAIRTENGQTGVYLLRGDHVEWRPVQLGASSITRAAVASGLAEDDMVALRTENPLHDGEAVRPIAR